MATVGTFGFVEKVSMANGNGTKEKLIKAKVTRQMKRDVERLARVRDESEALVVREALRRYITWAKRSGIIVAKR